MVMKKTERDRVEAARDALRKSEAEWKKAIAAVMDVVSINAENGNAVLSNAAFGVAADLTEELANMMRAHWRGTMVLLESWPDFAAEVVTRGPPR
jgi:hypothetical protein